jgi:hypothetical protein
VLNEACSMRAYSPRRAAVNGRRSNPDTIVFARPRPAFRNARYRLTVGVSVQPRRARSSARRAVVAASSTSQRAGSIATP